MSGSITVIGGVNNGNITGLVTVPVILPQTNILNTLQGFLTNTLQPSITGGTANFENLVVAGLSGSQAVTVANGANTVGDLTISNTEANGSVIGGNASVSVVVPVGYNVLYVQAPGTETITGNGSDNFLGVFGSLSGVTFNSNGGSGSIAAGGQNQFVLVSGTSWSVTGSGLGGDTINSNADSAFITTSGQGSAVNNAIGADTTPSNVVGLAGTTATVVSNGTNDLIETYSGSDVVSVNNSANVLINGGFDTVYATANSSAVKSFFNLFGGKLDFINDSNVAATVSGVVPGGSGGSTTAFGGVGGGIYIGGTAGNNSLVGGNGSAAGGVTLVGAGTNNFLSVQGAGSFAYNILTAGDGGATMVAGATTEDNEFHGGTGTDFVSSFGSGYQAFYVGATGAENYTGSTVTGSVNEYLFDQTSSDLGGSDVITNFRLGTDHIDINLFTSVTGVSITGFDSLGGNHTGSVVYLNDGTTIQLYGVAKSSLSSSIIGGTHI